MMWSPPQPVRYFWLVYEITMQIPMGQVATYGQIAALIPPLPGEDPDAYRRLGPRWVGTALRNCHDKRVPWQRVINSQGKISLPAGSTAAETQRRLLEAEGVVFTASDRVDLKHYRWAGPDAEWLAANGLQ